MTRLTLDSIGQAEIDLGKPFDRCTMDVVTMVSNVTCPDIQIKSEVPRDFEDGKLRYLDTKCWLEAHNKQFPIGEIRFEHYQKAINTNLMLQCGTDISLQAVRARHTRHDICILHNFQPFLPIEIAKQHLGHFMKILQNGTWGPEYKAELLASCINGYKNKLRRIG